ncbi:MAG: NUDIX domain-containing protein [Fusicatenibacter sp.]
MEKNCLTTLCYLERDDQYLMLHRVSKKNDINKDKWIGVGGHALTGESPEECLLREVKEETGYTLISWKFRGIVTFVTETGLTEYMCLYTADQFTGTEIACDEGVLEWVPKEQVLHLPIWEGDRIFLRLLEEDAPFFSLKLRYDQDRLVEAVLNGIPMELFEERIFDGSTTGVVMERNTAHREGRGHGTAHIWIVRKNQKSGCDVLLQKRSAHKDSNPGCYDISSAGHLSVGDSYPDAALRELREELGICAEHEDLREIGMHEVESKKVFYGKLFWDHEISTVYLYEKPVEINSLVLQESEVESVRWMDLEECMEAVRSGTIENCIDPGELEMIRKNVPMMHAFSENSIW